MRQTLWILSTLAAIAVVGCQGRKHTNDTGAASAGAESSAMYDTGTAVPSTGMTRDTGARDSARGNQTKSGVTNTKTGKSTLGPGVTQTRPDQNQPVTSKGDTLRHGTDTTGR